MADKKISALTAASTPLAGTEVLPIVQGGATVKVAVSDLTAGRAVTAAGVVSTSSVKGTSFYTTSQTITGIVSGATNDFAACDIPQDSSYLVTAKYVVSAGNNGIRTSIVSKQSSGAGSATLTSLNADLSAATTNVAIYATNNGSDTIIRVIVTTSAAGGSCTVTCTRIG
jgi:hypothetical protein